MFAARWNHWLNDRHRTRRAARAAVRRRRKRTFGGEALEDRQLLAVPLVTDHGGVILQNIQVETIYWGWAGPEAAMEPQLNNFVADLVAPTSSYWSGLAQYDVDSGSWVGSFDVPGAPPLGPANPGVTAPPGGVTTDVDVQAMLTANVGATNIPAPNANTLYLVFLPPGDPYNFTNSTGTITAAAASYKGAGVPQLLAWHTWSAANGSYAVIPYPGAVGGGFSNGAAADAPSELTDLTVVSSHEMVEAATDPEAFVAAQTAAGAVNLGFGWYFTPSTQALGPNTLGTEIGDPLVGKDFWLTTANAFPLGGFDSWYVQLYWSNFIPLSTDPHVWPQSTPKQPSTFIPTPPTNTSPTPPRPAPPAQPPLSNRTSPTPPIHTGPSIPGGASLVQPAIAASPTNPNDLAVASQNGVVISTNAGASWSSVIPFPTASSGDSSVVYNKSGNLFWSYLDPMTGGIEIVTLNPTTGAVTAGPFTVDAPASGSTDVQQDLAADNSHGSPQSNNLSIVWTQLGPSGKSEILLSISTNQGKTWLTPVTVAAPSITIPPTYYYGATVTIAPSGSITVAYHAQPGYTIEPDGGIVPNGTSGKTLAAVYIYNSSMQSLTQQGSTITALAAGQSDITFNDQSGSRTIAGTTFLTQGSVIPYVLVNPIEPGVMYVVTVEDPDAGTNKPPSSEVVIATLTQNANGTWSSATSVIAPPSSSSVFQLFPTATIDAVGDIVVSWYTNQSGAKNAAGDYLLDTYATYSANGGATWQTPFAVDSQPFDPDAGAAKVLAGPPPTTGIGNSFGVVIDGATVFVANDANSYTGTTATGQQVAVESFAMPGTLFILTSLGNNTITIQQVSSGSNTDEVLENNVVVAVAPIASLSGGITVGGVSVDGDEAGTPSNLENDTLILNYSNGDPVPTSGVTFNAAPGGTNIVELNADSNYTLSDSGLTISGNSVTGADSIDLDNVTAARLTGGPSNDSFTLHGWTGTTSITGGTGTNMLVVASGTVPTSTLTVSHVQTASVTGGTLDVKTSFSSIPAVQVQSAGILELDNGVTLTASNGVTNGGTLSLGGANIAAATIAGNYDQTSGGTLDIKLGGTGVGQYDQLHVTGNVTLSGTLSVSLVNGFTPTAGSSFQIITYMGTLAGDFTTDDFPALGGGNTWVTSSGNGSYTLFVISTI